jgi:outer membrane protein
MTLPQHFMGEQGDFAVIRQTMLRALPILALVLAAAPALAQDAQGAQDEAPDRNSLTLGAGAGYVPSYEGSDDYILIPVAVVSGTLGGVSFSSRGTTFNVDVIPDAKDSTVEFFLGPAVNVRLDRTSRIKDPQVRALGERDVAIELGGTAGIGFNRLLNPYDRLSVKLQVLKDVTDTHGSTIVTPSVEYETPLSTTTYAGIGLSADRVGDGYARTYFSVDPAGSAASGLPVYNADGGWKSWRLSLFAAHTLTGDLRHPGLSLFAVASYYRLKGDFSRSPIVSIAGDPNQYFAALGLAYTF